MKRLSLLFVLVTGCLLIYVSLYFPDWADPDSPASKNVSPYYLENAIADTAVPNVVSAVLADYRGFDTMFETMVIFAAGLSCYILLRQFKTKKSKSRSYRHLPTRLIIHIEEGGKTPGKESNFERVEGQWTPFDLITRTTSQITIPFIQIFALYVIVHGHYSPGGGFQGGVILGASFILFAISHNLGMAIKRFSEKTGALIGSIGVFLFAGTGMFCLLLGAPFLDYSALAGLFGTDPVSARSYAILIVEIGVGLSVMAVMAWLYYNLSSAGDHHEGL